MTKQPLGVNWISRVASEQYHSKEIRDTLLENLLHKKDLILQAEALLQVFHSENALYQITE